MEAQRMKRFLNKRMKIITITIFLLGIIVELLISNYAIIPQKISASPTKILQLDSFELKDFKSVGTGRLTSISHDPWVEIKGLNMFISEIEIKVKCENSNSLLQVFYKKIGEKYSEKNSYIFPTKKGMNTYKIKFGYPRNIESLRFDLTNQNNETVYLDYITINPKVKLEFSWSRYIFICLFLFVIFLSYFNYNELIKYRYPIAALIFLILVTGKFHGSSIAVWDKYITEETDSYTSTVLLGKARDIRSDEWLVHTPYIFSQKSIDYNVINTNIRSDGQNMVLPLVPTKSLDIIGKPFLWGFILFGNEYGLSWYWSSKLLLLLLTSFEISLFLSNKNKLLATIGAVWIALSPAIQWWFDTPAAFVELVIYAQAMIVITYYYVENPKRERLRLFLIVLFAACFIGYTTVIYPPIQVALGYLVLIFVFYIFYRNRDKVFLNRKEIFTFLFSLAIAFLVIGFYLVKSFDALKILSDTVYPGKRIDLGGKYDPAFLLLFLINWMLPFKSVNFLNNSIVSSYYSFIPVILITFFIVYKYEVKKKTLLLLLFSYFIFQLSWLFVSYPPIFAKITLFSYVPEYRMIMVVGLTSTYISIWLFSLLVSFKPINIVKSIFIAFIAGLIYYLSIYHSEMASYLGTTLSIGTVGFFTFLSYLFVRGNFKIFSSLLLVLVIISGLTVNPISRGVDAIYEKKLSKKILEIEQNDPKQLWVAANSLVNGQFLIALGIKTFNGVHFYPDLKRWEHFSTKEDDKDIYNRYAHVMVNIVNDKTSFSLKQTDVFELSLNKNELSKHKIKYILSQGEISQFSDVIREVYYEPNDNIYIYKVKE
jgi:MFS family permease